jgi:hypothetical protein
MPPVPCWLCGRPTGTTIVASSRAQEPGWARRGADARHLPADAHRQFHQPELQRAGLDVDVLLAHPPIRKFVDWVANKDPDFTASVTKKGR